MAETGRRRGPKVKTVNWEEVDRLLKCQATEAQIALYLGMGVSTLQRRCKKNKKIKFDQYASQKRDAYKLDLTWLMVKDAEGGNNVMKIWVSKNLLGWSDNAKPVKHDLNINLKYDPDGPAPAPASDASKESPA